MAKRKELAATQSIRQCSIRARTCDTDLVRFRVIGHWGTNWLSYGSSFSRGSAVFAFELGIADNAVQLLGDWSSPAFTQYLEFAFSEKASVADQIVKGFNSGIKKCIWKVIHVFIMLFLNDLL